MKRKLTLLLMAACIAQAHADEAKLLKLDDPTIYLPSALGKQMDVRFADTLVATHFDKTDFDALVLSDLPEGKACFFGGEQGLDPASEKLKDIGRPETGDICVARGDVSIRYVPSAEANAAPIPFYATDKQNCTWQWKAGKGIGIWSEDCKFDTGEWAVNYDEANDLYALSVDGGDPFPVLRQFRKGAEEGPEALLPALRKAGLVPDNPECVFAPTTDHQAPPGWSLWQIVPTGKLKEDYEKQLSVEVPDPPCGDVGMSADSISFFMIPEAQKDRVLYVNLGQDGTLFDPFSIKLF